MRATLLLLLGGILVWFVWHSFGSSDATALASTSTSGTSAAGAAQPAGSGAGAVLPAGFATNSAVVQVAKSDPVPSKEPVSSRASLEGGIPVVPAASEKPASKPAPQAAAPTPSPAVASDAQQQGSGSSRSRSGDLASDIELARALVSDPKGFAALVSTRSDLSRSRRDYALALSKALTGAEPEATRLLQGLEESPDVHADERDFLKRCIDHRQNAPISAALESESLLVRAGAMVAAGGMADADRAAGKNKSAARTYSELLLDYVHAPWAADPAVLRRWSEGLNTAQRGYRWDKNGDWPAVTIKVEPGDFLIALRKRVLQEHPELLICTGQIERANQISGSVLRPGQVLRVPTDRAHMLVDLDAHWAFYLLGDEVAAAWEVGVGKEGKATRVGTYTVGEKKEKPMWFRPGGSPVPYGDPENPLGTRWIAWMLPTGETSGLGFHGTNDPTSVGKDQSQGCIRMRDADVEELCDILPKDAVISVEL